MSEIVGATTSGPMKRMTNPINPEKPMRTWKILANMMAPWICKKNGQLMIILKLLDPKNIIASGKIFTALGAC